MIEMNVTPWSLFDEQYDYFSHERVKSCSKKNFNLIFTQLARCDSVANYALNDFAQDFLTYLALRYDPTKLSNVLLETIHSS